MTPGPDEARVEARQAAPTVSAAGIYTFFWRATPFPFLTTFDAPGGVQTCTRRLRSNTPLQALTLLNDPAMVEIAQALAARIVARAARPAETRTASTMPSVLPEPRRPTSAERATILRLLRQAIRRQAGRLLRGPRLVGRGPRLAEPRRVRDPRVNVGISTWRCTGTSSDADRRGPAVCRRQTRRHFFSRCGVGLGSIALASLLA